MNTATELSFWNKKPVLWVVGAAFALPIMALTLGEVGWLIFMFMPTLFLFVCAAAWACEAHRPTLGWRVLLVIAVIPASLLANYVLIFTILALLGRTYYRAAMILSCIALCAGGVWLLRRELTKT
jgi:hypothetical protein